LRFSDYFSTFLDAGRTSEKVDPLGFSSTQIFSHAE
jgi:hypothetical protein